MTALLEEARRATGARSGFVGRWDEQRQLLVEFISLRNTSGVPRTLALGEGAGGRAAQQRIPVIVDDYQALVRATPRLGHSRARVAVAAPLLREGRLLGVVVCVSDEQGKRFTHYDAESLVMLGSVVASTLVELKRAQTAQELRLATERLDQFMEATSDAIMVTGTHMRLLGWNRGAERLYGWTRQEVLGHMLPNVPAEDQAANRETVADGPGDWPGGGQRAAGTSDA
jgi:PAS domain-containing protein